MEEIFNTELGRKILALTKASFKVSDLIPDLILREKIKHQVLEVYKIFFEKNHQELLKEIDALDSLFYLAGHLNLAKENYVRSLRNGFLVFKSHIILAINEQPKYVGSVLPENNLIGNKTKRFGNIKSGALNARQQKIINFCGEKGEARLADLVGLFPEISEKTVRNDLLYLIEIGKINKLGRGIYRPGNGN